MRSAETSAVQRVSLSFLLLVNIAATSAPATQPSYLKALGPRQWTFPYDHGRHDGFRTEWWYFTGNLADRDGRRFGFQLTFFRTALAAGTIMRPSPWATHDLYFAHAAVSDVDGKQFLFNDRLERGRPGLAFASADQLDVQLLDWSSRQESDGIHLNAIDDRFAIDLLCGGGAGPVLQGPGGVNVKGHEPGEASFYYSMTRLHTQGRVSIAGQSFHVTGLSWMDHEFSSNALGKNQVGWDWMGLQMKDGTGLMLYRIRDKDGGTDYLSGTRIGIDGTPHYLPASEISLQPGDSWQSPKTGAAYPQTWRVIIRSFPPIIVKSLLPQQELMTEHSTKVSYFEGAAEVLGLSGQPIGEGYLEMTGYDRSLKTF